MPVARTGLPATALAGLFVDASVDAHIALDSGGRVQLWSPGAVRTFGYDEEEALGRPLAELIVPPDRRDEHAALFTEIAVRGQFATSLVRRHRDGMLLAVEASFSTVADERGRITHYIGTLRDNTEARVRRDAEFIDARYRDLLESVPDPTVIVNEFGRIVLFNGHAERMFGHDRRAMIGATIETLLPERYRRAHAGHRTGYFGQPRTRNMGAGLELYGLRADGSEFPVEISLGPLQTPSGLFVMSAIRDTTERRSTERALQEKNAELLLASQAKDRFLATMSHELRTPLNPIIGFTGILLMKLPGPLTAEQERQLGTIKSSAQHLLSLINDLLDLAKIQSGKVELRRDPVACDEVLEAVDASLRAQAQARGIDFTLRLPSTPTVLDTDRRALHQILLNLVANAIKFTDEGGVTLELRRSGRPEEVTREADMPPPAGRLDFVVSDTGVGIEPDDLARLFGAFAQVGDPRRKTGGTGLGLHLSARLAELLGGRIEVESRPGGGSRFTLVLEPVSWRTS
ncbi:sensor histidine kinase [Derxia gummosa]|uniref:histidine kinase n=1 Tax=Derxia gummosa DSM 723 TaxID=1121388 RepID=A0A8B6X856_9BURK|nr:PAS domain S-box protein [Derxia gummosa]